jgi:hypothetical protein
MVLCCHSNVSKHACCASASWRIHAIHHTVHQQPLHTQGVKNNTLQHLCGTICSKCQSSSLNCTVLQALGQNQRGSFSAAPRSDHKARVLTWLCGVTLPTAAHPTQCGWHCWAPTSVPRVFCTQVPHPARARCNHIHKQSQSAAAISTQRVSHRLLSYTTHPGWCESTAASLVTAQP